MYNSSVCNLAGPPLITVLLIAGCTTVHNVPGTPTHYEDPSAPGTVSGVGIESQDIVSMTDQMLRDLFEALSHSRHGRVPRIIIDARYFENQGAQRINKNLIVDRLRIELQRAAQGRLLFVGREYSPMVAREREMKRSGLVDVATRGFTDAQAGADYRLGGRISTLDVRDGSTGRVQRYNQITFEMVDLETGVIAWSGLYEFKKAAQDHAVYR